MMIPFQVGRGEFNVFVILEADNVARMKENDPAQINLWKMPAPFDKLKLRDVIITTPAPEDIAEAVLLIRAGKTKDAFEYLSRGFKFKPKEGDNNLPLGIGLAARLGLTGTLRNSSAGASSRSRIVELADHRRTRSRKP